MPGVEDHPIADAIDTLSEVRDREVPREMDAELDVLRGNMENIRRLVEQARKHVPASTLHDLDAIESRMEIDLDTLRDDVTSALGNGIAELEHLRRPVVHISSTGVADAAIRKRRLPDAVIVVDNAFVYTTDETSRVVRTEATLTLREPGKRDKRAQRYLEGKLPGDDAGHLIARILGGIGHELNLVPMLREVNRQQMARLEKNWRHAVKLGKSVDLNIELEYVDDSNRPASLSVSYKVEGEKRRTVELENPLPEETRP